MTIRDFVRGEKPEKIEFHVDAERKEAGFKYEAHIYEVRDGEAVNPQVGYAYADSQIGLRFAVRAKCRAIRRKKRAKAKGDPKPWRVKL